MSTGVGSELDGSRNSPGQRRPLLVRGETLKLNIDRKTAGRPKPWPTTIEEAAARVIAQSSSAVAILEATPARYIGDDTILEIVLHHYALAASSYPARLFLDCGFVHVGSAVRNDSRAVYVAIPDNGLRTLLQIARSAVDASREVQDGIQALDTISVAHGTRRDQQSATPRADALFEIVLHGQQDGAGHPIPASDSTVSSVQDLIMASGGTTEDRWIRRSDTATFVPARIGKNALSEILKHNAVRICQSMPQLRDLPTEIPLDQLPLTFSLSAQLPPSNIPPLKVAVFDGGVDDSSPMWQGRVVHQQIGSPIPSVAARAHGALVTSAMLYGHLTGYVLPPPVNIDITHYAAIPQSGREQDLQMYWLLDTMEQEIRKHDYDVVLVCIGPDLIVADDHIDRWTSTIDQLSFEEDVLFVVAAGNNGELDSTTRMNRILVPADTVNGIAVGATGSPTGKDRAPYSATGPGRTAAQILPTGIAFGGSEAEPFGAVDNDGARLQFRGTSCAAPLVVHGLARAAARLGLHYRSSTILRCCAIHFAEKSRGQQPDHVGYGHLPQDYPEIYYTEPHLVHVLYEGATNRGDIDTLAIPMPENLPGPVDLRITLVSTSEVNSSDAGDYVGAGLDITFRPDTTLYKFTSPIDEKLTEDVSVTRDPELCRNLLDAGWKRSSQPIPQSWTVKSKTEVSRREGGKWESVQVIDHTLRIPFVQPRIELQHLSRKRAVLTKGTPPLKWTMLVTLQCPRGTELYRAVRAQFPSLQPHVATIEPDAGPDIDIAGDQ